MLPFELEKLLPDAPSDTRCVKLRGEDGSGDAWLVLLDGAPKLFQRRSLLEDVTPLPLPPDAELRLESEGFDHHLHVNSELRFSVSSLDLDELREILGTQENPEPAFHEGPISAPPSRMAVHEAKSDVEDSFGTPDEEELQAYFQRVYDTMLRYDAAKADAFKTHWETPPTAVADDVFEKRMQAMRSLRDSKNWGFVFPIAQHNLISTHNSEYRRELLSFVMDAMEEAGGIPKSPIRSCAITGIVLVLVVVGIVLAILM